MALFALWVDSHRKLRHLHREVTRSQALMKAQRIVDEPALTHPKSARPGGHLRSVKVLAPLLAAWAWLRRHPAPAAAVAGTAAVLVLAPGSIPMGEEEHHPATAAPPAVERPPPRTVEPGKPLDPGGPPRPGPADVPRPIVGRPVTPHARPAPASSRPARATPAGPPPPTAPPATPPGGPITVEPGPPGQRCAVGVYVQLVDRHVCLLPARSGRR